MINFRPAGACGARFRALEGPVIAASLALGFGVASPAFAQDAQSSEQPAPSQRIIVTGDTPDEAGLDKIATPLIDTPQAISIVTKEDLENRGINNLNDALRNVAGISIGAGETSFQGNNASLRGFTTRNDLFVDNIRD